MSLRSLLNVFVIYFKISFFLAFKLGVTAMNLSNSFFKIISRQSLICCLYSSTVNQPSSPSVISESTAFIAAIKDIY